MVFTIRAYDQIWLIEPHELSEGNQRRYESAARDAPSFVARLPALGLGTEAFRDLLRLSRPRQSPCTEWTS